MVCMVWAVDDAVCVHVLYFPHGHSQLTHQNWGSVLAWRMCLNCLSIPMQVNTPDPLLPAVAYRIDLHRCFARALLFSLVRLAQ